MAQQIVIEVPGTKISELEPTSHVTAEDVTPVVQNGETKKAPLDQVAELVKSGLGSAALKDVSEFATPALVAQVSTESQIRDDAQNERIDRVEAAIYLFQNNGVYKAYRTKDEMLADTASIPVDSIVTVVADPANDPEVNDINGQYHWNGDDFLKINESLEQTIKNLKEYFDQAVNSGKVVFNASIEVDKNGTIVNPFNYSYISEKII